MRSYQNSAGKFMSIQKPSGIVKQSRLPLKCFQLVPNQTLMEESGETFSVEAEVVFMPKEFGHSRMTISYRAVFFLGLISIAGCCLIAMVQTVPRLPTKYRHLLTVFGAVLASPTFFLLYYLYRIVLPPFYQKRRSTDDVDEEPMIGV